MLLGLCKSMSLVDSEVCELCSGPDTRTLAYLLCKMQVQWRVPGHRENKHLSGGTVTVAPELLLEVKHLSLG